MDSNGALLVVCAPPMCPIAIYYMHAQTRMQCDHNHALRKQKHTQTELPGITRRNWSTQSAVRVALLMSQYNSSSAMSDDITINRNSYRNGLLVPRASLVVTEYKLQELSWSKYPFADCIMISVMATIGSSIGVLVLVVERLSRKGVSDLNIDISSKQIFLPRLNG